MAGRRSFTTVDAHSWELGHQRLKPPAYLSDRERAAFVDLVSSCPLAQFTAADIPLLARWCECQVMAEQAAAELRARGMVTSDGKVSPWFTIHQQATKSQALLALRLRLGPQSRANKAPKTMPAPMSAYERMALEDDDDDDVGRH